MIATTPAFDAANTQSAKKPIFIVEIDGYHYAFSNGEEDADGLMWLHVEGQE